MRRPNFPDSFWAERAAAIIARYKAGETQEELAAAYGTKREDIGSFLRRRGVQLTRDERAARWRRRSDRRAADNPLKARNDEVVRRYESETQAAIAEAMGLTEPNVCQILMRAGVRLSRTERGRRIAAGNAAARQQRCSAPTRHLTYDLQKDQHA